MKQPTGKQVTYNGQEYLVSRGGGIYLRRHNAIRTWWQRMSPKGPTAKAVKRKLFLQEPSE